MAYLRDRKTGEAPTLRRGDSFTFTTVVVDGVEIPDAMTDNCESVQLCDVKRAEPAPIGGDDTVSEGNA